MKIGARVIKTGLAITLAIYISQFLLPSSTGTLAAIGASLSTQPTIKKSFEMMVSRIKANIIGGVVAVIMVYMLNTSPVTIGLTSIMTIAILNGLKMVTVIPLSIINITVIMLGETDNIAYYALLRVLETTIGVVVSFLVNWLIAPPKYDTSFFNVLESTTLEVFMFLRAAMRKNTEFVPLSNDLVWAKERVAQYQEYFGLMRQDALFTPKQRVNARRRLAVYREMGRATQAAVELLNTLHHNAHVYDTLPMDLRTLYRERIETLLSAHEQIMLKLYGKVGVDQVKFIKTSQESRDELMQIFLEIRDPDPDLSVDQMIRQENAKLDILSASVHYEEHLMKLNHIVRLYKKRRNHQLIKFNHFQKI